MPCAACGKGIHQQKSSALSDFRRGRDTSKRQRPLPRPPGSLRAGDSTQTLSASRQGSARQRISRPGGKRPKKDLAS